MENQNKQPDQSKDQELQQTLQQNIKEIEKQNSSQKIDSQQKPKIEVELVLELKDLEDKDKEQQNKNQTNTNDIPPATNLADQNSQQKVQVIEPILIQRPPTPDDIPLKPDLQSLQLLSLIINRLRILERNIAVYNDDLRDLHLDRERQLTKIQLDLNQMYEDYQQFLQQQEQGQQILEQKIKVEIDYNLIRIMEQKLKMDREVYIMRKKLYERTVRMRELQVKVYNYKQEKKDLLTRIKELEDRVDEREREVRRMQDIVYDVTTLNIKPNFAMGSNQLSVPKFKNYDQYMIKQQKELQQQKYFMDNQTLKFGRKQNEVLRDGIWHTQLMGGTAANNNLLANTGKLMLHGSQSMGMLGINSGGMEDRRQMGGVLQGMSLNELLPESWINNKYISTIDKPKFEDTLNERDYSQYGDSSQKSSVRANNKMSPSNSDIRLGQKQYY